MLDLQENILQIEQTKKRKRDNVNYTFMWQCILSHINKTRLNKLHKDGLLELSDYELYSTCESCLMGKITKSPFSGKRR